MNRIGSARELTRRGIQCSRAACHSVVVILLSLAVTACPPPPAKSKLATSDTSHSFAPGESDWTFQVWNSGAAGSTLTFTVTSDQSYVTVTPPNGSSASASDKADVKVTVDRNAFAKSSLSAKVTVSSNGGDSVIPVTFSATTDKFALWTHGTRLRGANISQRRVYPELDGPTFMGSGAVGPPYTQADFDRLAASGANYVNISHPGLYAEKAPFAVDAGVQANLDAMIAMAENAGLFVVISARTGPGRSEFTFIRDQAGSLFPETYLDDSVWESQAAQDAWVAMWAYTAQRYQNHAAVVGYDLMVEPNSNAVFFNDYDPQHFYAQHAGSLYDWNQLHPRIAAAIRAVDANTPILVGGMSYSAAAWLPYLALTGVARSVYTVHTYEPMIYTHQDSGPPHYTYPGSFDADGDGHKDNVNRAWLDAQLAPLDTFAADHGVPVAVNEFGVHRWAPGADKYMDDMMSLLEEHGVNHALWIFNSSWPEYASIVDDFDFLHGPKPTNHTIVTSPLRTVIESYWSRNGIFP